MENSERKSMLITQEAFYGSWIVKGAQTAFAEKH
jgi:hypothetical protein